MRIVKLPGSLLKLMLSALPRGTKICPRVPRDLAENGRDRLVDACAFRAFGGIIVQVTSVWNRTVSFVTYKIIKIMVYGRWLSLNFDKGFVTDGVNHGPNPIISPDN